MTIKPAKTSIMLFHPELLSKYQQFPVKRGSRNIQGTP
jgi:hypothetical protein